MRRRFLTALAAATLLAACASAPSSFTYTVPDQPEAASGYQAKPGWATTKFAVAAANPLATDAGYHVLKAGGSAIDAAVAAQMVLTLVEPQSSGIGGGAFMLVHDAKRNKLFAYDGRETAPAAAKPERFLDSDGKPLAFYTAVVGGKSVGVPGTVALIAEAHKRHGRLPWKKLFEPAIDLAEYGFPVSERLNVMVATEERISQPRAREYFYDFLGNPIPVGRLLKNPAYAATLRKIAAGGPRAFYEGEIARDIVATVTAGRRNPGDITLADLANYRVKVREPVCGTYRVYRVCGMPLPSSGGPTVLQMLGILEPYDMKAMGPATLWSVHFISEAGRLAYADRSVYMADPSASRLSTGRSGAATAAPVATGIP